MRYLGYCGASAVVLPERLADRSLRRALEGQADEDSTGPDQLEVFRRLLARQGLSLWLELGFDGPGALPGLPRPDSPEAVGRGLVRVDRQGRPAGPAYHPLNPEVRDAMKRRVTQALAQIKLRPGEAGDKGGLLIRLGPGPTLLGTPDTGLDDATFDRFVRESFSPETARGIPGTGETDPDRFAVRSRYLAGVGRMPWLTWRSRAIASLYTELVEAAQAASPGAVLAVVTPGLDNGPAGIEARRVDRAGLAPSQAWRSVGSRSPGLAELLRPLRLSSAALCFRRMHWDTTWRPAPTSTHWSPGRQQRGLLLTIHDDPPVASGGRPVPDKKPTARPSRLALPHHSRLVRRLRTLPEPDPTWKQPANLADGTAARRRSDRRRAARTCHRRTRCAMGLPGGQGGRRSRRTAPPLCHRSARPAGLAASPAQ